MFWHRPIVKSSQIPKRIQQEEIDVWVCSFGGCGTNMLADYLVSKSFKLRTPIWHELICHSAAPVSVPSPIKAIYLFGDPVLAFESMKRRRWFSEANLRKLNNRMRMTYRDESLFKSMLHQFGLWTRPNETNLDILVVKFEDLFDCGKLAIGEFLQLDVSDFPHRRARNTDRIDRRERRAFMETYEAQIDAVTNYPSFQYLPPAAPHQHQALLPRAA